MDNEQNLRPQGVGNLQWAIAAETRYRTEWNAQRMETYGIFKPWQIEIVAIEPCYVVDCQYGQ